jgi:integrase
LGERCIESLIYQRTDSLIDSLIVLTRIDSLVLRNAVIFCKTRRLGNQMNPTKPKDFATRGQNKKAPVTQPWIRRLAAVSGFVPESAVAEARLGWYGVELVKFLNFCKGLPANTDLRHAMEGYGRILKGAEPPLPDWRIEQVREALRLFQRGIDGWYVGAADEWGEVKVDFRIKTADAQATEAEDARVEGEALGAGALPAANTGGTPVLHGEDLLLKAEGVMRVKRMARRTVETYLGWMRRFLAWVEERSLQPATLLAVRGFLTWLAMERKVSAATQNQAFSAVVFLTSEVMGVEVEGIDAVRAKRSARLPEVLSRDEVKRLLAVVEGTTGLMLKLMYGTGMRLMECVRLRVKDLDFDRCVITVRGGKGDKDCPWLRQRPAEWQGAPPHLAA